MQIKKRPTVVTLVGAKGGVGTSVLALNLAMALARLEHQVVLVEADLEGAGVGTMLGRAEGAPGIAQWMAAKRQKLDSALGPEIEPRLRLLARGSAMAPPNPHPQKKRKLTTGLKRLEAEFVVVELGRGLMAQDLALDSHGCIAVFTPERTALHGLQTLATALAVRALESHLRENSTARGLLEQFRTSGGELAGLVKELGNIKTLKRSPGEIIGQLRIKLVANRLKNVEDMACAREAAGMVQEATGLVAEVIGFIPEDPLVTASIANATPALELEPRARFSKAIALLALGLEPWAARGAQWADRPAESGSFERAASAFAPIFQEV